jgi:hypothetical protein
VSVRLEAIQFNHDASSASHDALNLRRNATEFVTTPEWRRGFSVVPEDSPAAYSIEDTAGLTLTIRAKFKRTDPSVATAWVRAVDAKVEPSGKPGCLGFLLRLLHRVLRALFGNVLGVVRARQVTFMPSGETAFEQFKLRHTKVRRVGVYTTEWKWQYRLQPADPWTDFDTSTHRIYVVLRAPTAAWQQFPYNAANTQLPWSEVLDYACSWARGATDTDTAAGRITKQIYDLGPAVVEYDCPGGGASQYSSGGFDCTAFLERLSGGVGNGQYVNCSDCATVLSSVANAVGCDLWQSRMGWGFSLNPLLAIGSNIWQTACGWGGFSYHEVAWKGACTANEEVFDACLQVDGDADPTAPPHTPLLPVDMVFGVPGDGNYRDRLSPAGACDAQPGSRTRRTIF